MHLTNRGDRDYEARRAVYNAMIELRPRLIASCETPQDVAEALTKAREDGLEVAVRAGGHSVAGMSSVDDGLVIDVRPMKAIEIDPANRTARVAAGVTWGEFDAAAQVHGLAMWEDAADDDRARSWVREYRSAMSPFTNGGVYLNFIGDEGEDRVKAAFGEDTYARLAAIKHEYDPDNVFHRNQNITPAAG
ncbi:MAG: FAD-binding protein [Nocardioidaceae bacterium]